MRQKCNCVKYVKVGVITSCKSKSYADDNYETVNVSSVDIVVGDLICDKCPL